MTSSAKPSSIEKGSLLDDLDGERGGKMSRCGRCGAHEDDVPCGCNQRIGDWILTASGIHYYPLDPRKAEVSLDDVAHALSQQCRFGGHTRRKNDAPRHYSVAEHAVYASFIAEAAGCGKEVQLRTLHHDSPEGVLVDLPRPVKKAPEMAFYEEVETRNMDVMADALGLMPMSHPVVDMADELMLAIEMRDLMPFASLDEESRTRFMSLIERARKDLWALTGDISAERARLLVMDMIDLGIERPFLPSAYHWKQAFLARDRAIRGAVGADHMIRIQKDTSTMEGCDAELARRMKQGETGPKRCSCQGKDAACGDCSGRGWVL